MKRLVLLGGGLQVVLSILFTTVIAYVLGRSVRQSIFLFSLRYQAPPSCSKPTSIAQIDAPHGRAAVGILLFQDLSIVPMMLMIPILSGRNASSTSQIVMTFVTALVAIAAIILATHKVVPFLLHHIVRLRSPEVFIISVVLIGLGTSFLTAQFGLSLAPVRSSRAWSFPNRNTAIRSSPTFCRFVTSSTVCSSSRSGCFYRSGRSRQTFWSSSFWWAG